MAGIGGLFQRGVLFVYIPQDNPDQLLLIGSHQHTNALC